LPNRRTLSALGLLALIGLIVALAVLLPGGTRPQALPGLRVSHGRVVDGTGRPLRVMGVNRSGTEYACVHGRGIFDGPSDDASIAAIAGWGANAVRVPLNEDCWLGLNGLNPALSGRAYQLAIHAYVNRLLAHRLDVILDLHWAAPGQERALGLSPAPDADHAPAFWSSVAAQFRGVAGVAFDLFNEPHGISWSCWRSGCRGPGGWRTAGMQQLLDSVRRAGARQPVIAEGLEYGADLSGWLAHRPRDPAGQLLAGWHIYNDSQCHQTSCWDRSVARVARVVPVLATEVGETDCTGRFLARVLPWADARRIGYLAWTWNPNGCSLGPSLITDYAGTPTRYGAAYLAHIDPALAARYRRLARTSFDFRVGTEGWTVRWGSDLSLGGVQQIPATRARGLALDVTGPGWPAAGSGRGVQLVGPGSRVTYRLWAPGSVAAGLRPMLTAFDWRVTLLAARPLHSGWNTIAFRVPPELRDVRILGLQLDDPAGWKGRLLLGGVSWSAASGAP